jgi:alkaline phosphatase D
MVLRGFARFAAGFSTVALRLLSVIFLRWIPARPLWPAVIFFWILFILSFILLLYLDPELTEPIAQVETTDIVEVVTNGAGEKIVVETEIDTITIPASRVPKGQPRPISWMETIYLGIPNPNPLLSFATTATNAVMLLMTLDLAFRRYLFHPAMDLSLHRPVPISPHSCNILIRWPPENLAPVQVYYKNVEANFWNTGPAAQGLNDATDYTSVVKLEDLIPGTSYKYAVLPSNVDIKAANESSFGAFETFPRKGTHGRFSFGSSSCLSPGFPYNPLKSFLEIKGLQYLEHDAPNLKFFAFLGPSLLIPPALPLRTEIQATLFTLIPHIANQLPRKATLCNIDKFTHPPPSQKSSTISHGTTSSTTTKF